MNAIFVIAIIFALGSLALVGMLRQVRGDQPMMRRRLLIGAAVLGMALAIAGYVAFQYFRTRIAPPQSPHPMAPAAQPR